MLRPGGAFVSAIAVLVVVASSPSATRADPRARRTVVLGRSADGRSIAAVETGDLDAHRRMLVVGCIHGNETAGIPVARWLARSRPPKELDLWIVPDLNPDGAAAGRHPR
jgi:murein tripeptide amidase MpaA